MRLKLSRFRDLFQRGLDIRDVCFDEQWVVIEGPELLDIWGAVADQLLCVSNVFKILPATRVRTISSSHKSERVLNSIIAHSPDRVRKQGMPVAIAEIDRQVRSIGFQLPLERRNQFSILSVYRAHAA